MCESVEYMLSGSSEWLDINANNNKEKFSQSLLTSMQMQNVMVLAGSGTSIGVSDAPSMKDLWNSCTKKDFSEDEPKVFSDLAVKVFKRVNKEDISDENADIELFLSKCEAYQQLNNNCEVSRYVVFCKTQILQQCILKLNQESLSAHKKFIHSMSRRRVRDSRLQLFTTNYDKCFEIAASMQGNVVIDGFSFNKPRFYDSRFFDFDIVRRSSQSETPDNYLEGVIKLYKLHGSVNWKRKKDGSIVECKIEPEDAADACMIFPAKGKYQQSYMQPHLELMGRYLSALREPNTCLLIIGFGFNDDHLSEPIIAAIQSNPYLKVIIADYNAKQYITEPTESTSEYWQNLSELSNNGYDISFINAKFDDFVKLIPDLRSLTPAEKMAQAIKNITGGDNDG